MFSCKKEVKEEVIEEVIEEVEVIEKVEESTSTAPSFDNKDVQAYVDSYESYITSYTKAVESKDMTLMADLGKKGQELATMSQTAMKNLKGDDLAKFTTYMTESSKKLQALAAKMTAQ